MSNSSTDRRLEKFVPQYPARNLIPVSSSKPIPLQYMESFLRFTYYIGICPNRYKPNNFGSYEATRNWFQTGISGAYVILAFLIRIFGLRQVKGTHEKQQLDPVEYFTAAREIGLLIYAGAIFHTFWFNAQDICNFLNLAARFGSKQNTNWQQSVKDSKITWLFKNQVALAIIGCALYAILSMVTIIGGLGDRFSWDMDQFFYGFAQEGRGILFIPMSSSNTNSTLTPDPSTLDVAFVVFCVLTYFAENLYMCIGDALLTISAILLLVCVQEFESKLTKISTEEHVRRKCACVLDFARPSHSRPNFHFADILEEFDHMVQVVSRLNQVIGLLVFGLTLGSLPFFVNDFLNLLNPPSTMVLLRVLLYFVHLMTFIMIAAKVNKKAQALETWMSQRENYTMLKRSGASLGVEEMIAIQQGKYVGISVAGFFVITFGFVGSWISLLLTFVIVIMEFRSSA